MGKEQEEYILKICESELQKNEAYVNIQKRMTEAYHDHDVETYSELSIMMQIIIEKCCFKLAIKELLNIIAD